MRRLSPSAALPGTLLFAGACETAPDLKPDEEQVRVQVTGMS